MGQRLKEPMNDNPGPGSYDQKNDLTKASAITGKIGASQRKTFVQEAPNDLPGPGSNDVDLNLIGKDGPKITFRTKPIRNDDTISPGPGAYNSKVETIKNSAASVRMSSAERVTYFAQLC